MEYKVFRFFRHQNVIPYIFRLFLGILLIFLSSIPIILPLFPGSFFLGVSMLVVGLILIIQAKKIKHVIKLRKGLTYLVRNIRNRNIIKHKIYDIKKHIKKILEDKKYRNK